ncbi:MAG: DUF6364 family protein [Balneolaceae bacterium]
MGQKLTLSIDKDIIKNAKEYAKEEGTSVSKLVENYLRMIVQDESVAANEPITTYHTVDELSPIIKSLTGIIDKNKITKNERFQYLKKKYQ